MGDPRKTRKKYSTPNHPWEQVRIEEEKALKTKYSLKNKKEIWKMTSLLSGFKKQAKKLSSLRTKQAEMEEKLLLAKLVNLGLLKSEDTMESILTLRPEDIMERRLQTIVVNKGLARSMKQARQFITHGHVSIGDKVVTAPSFLVVKPKEDSITFRATSQLSDAMHPERHQEKPVEKPKEEKDAKA